jgi:hypothetical protein
LTEEPLTASFRRFPLFTGLLDTGRLLKGTCGPTNVITGATSMLPQPFCEA